MGAAQGEQILESLDLKVGEPLSQQDLNQVIKDINALKRFDRVQLIAKDQDTLLIKLERAQFVNKITLEGLGEREEKFVKQYMEAHHLEDDSLYIARFSSTENLYCKS